MTLLRQALCGNGHWCCWFSVYNIICNELIVYWETSRRIVVLIKLSSVITKNSNGFQDVASENGREFSLTLLEKVIEFVQN